MAILNPVKFLKCTILNPLESGTWPTAPYVGFSYRWTATLNIPTPQPHGNSTLNGGFYTAASVNVGDYVVSGGQGKILKITAISSRTSNQVSVTLEDEDLYNSINDDTQSNSGLINNGASQEAYIFEIKAGRPVISNVPLALPGNLPATFVAALHARFELYNPLTVQVGNGTATQLSFNINERVDVVPGTDTSVTFNDTTNTITIGSTVVDATTSKAGHLSIADKTKLDGIAAGATAYSHPTSGVTAGTYTKVTVNSLGHVTSATSPTLLADYGITDAQAKSTGLGNIATQSANASVGFLKKTAADTWTLDSSTYLTANQSITVSGDATGTGTTAIALTLSATGVTAGTYKSVTVDTKGRVTTGTNPTTLAGFGITDGVIANAAITAGTSTKITYDAKGLVTGGAALVATDIPVLDWSKITTGKPTTLSGYGITDAQLGSTALTSVSTLVAGTPNGLLRKTAANTVAVDTSLDSISTVSANASVGLLSKTAANTWTLDTNSYALASHSHSNATTSTAGFMSAGDKTKLDSYPAAVSGSSVTAVFSFTVNFNVDAPGTVTGLPSGWSAALSGNDVTITHTVGNVVKMLNYWGKTVSTGEERFRMPTAGNELTIVTATMNSAFKFRINTSVAGAESNSSARVVCYF